MRYLSVAAIFKNEAPYLREWIEFHRMVGVEHFYLYDNGSTDNPVLELREYVMENVVTLRPWPGKVAQKAAYEAALVQSRDASRWLAFIDLDEYLWSPTGAVLPEVLPSYEDHPAVVANWCVFGPGPVGWETVTKPEGPVIDEYVGRVPDDDPINTHVKSIVNPREVLGYTDPHSFTYSRGVAVNEEHYPVMGPLTDYVSFDVLRVNHYFTKSREEAEAKWGRGRADTGTRRDWSEYEALAANCTVTDNAIREQYAIKLMGRLG
jgi:hypothetical protein